jgi:hypothetical protein
LPAVRSLDDPPTGLALDAAEQWRLDALPDARLETAVSNGGRRGHGVATLVERAEAAFMEPGRPLGDTWRARRLRSGTTTASSVSSGAHSW